MFLTFYNTLLPINHPPHNQDISDILVLFEIPANKFLSITIQNLIKLWNLSETSISKFLRLVLFYCWVFPRENPFYCQNHGLIVLRLERPKTLFPAVLSAGLSLTNVPSNPPTQPGAPVWQMPSWLMTAYITVPPCVTRPGRHALRRHTTRSVLTKLDQTTLAKPRLGLSRVVPLRKYNFPSKSMAPLHAAKKTGPYVTRACR